MDDTYLHITYGLLGAMLVMLIALVSQLAYRYKKSRWAQQNENTVRSAALESVTVEEPPVPLLARRVSMPRFCGSCGEYVHPALIGGHLEVCRLRQMQNVATGAAGAEGAGGAAPPGEHRPPSPVSSAASDIDDDSKCVICIEKRRSVAFVPCGHWTCCVNCAKKVETCPFCRNDITQYLLVSGETVNKCPVCSLQIHHTFYTSHREVCRIQIKMREARLKEEGERSSRQGSVASIKETPEAAEEARCCVCLAKPREIAFSPCGHWSTCAPCAEGLKECPICNTEIAKSLTIYS
eukprot:TRINITY_DN3302_c0_g2_i2.p1 TRINITY_DN3302_c0_g2~~TRINITY_DN3302_c0_g2_i2.p1  ORF type:complete len:303 (+),score=55.05 TRINITY_DN3302_c0_g2_i2:30-911(+)